MFEFEDPNIILGQEMYNFYNNVKENWGFTMVTM